MIDTQNRLTHHIAILIFSIAFVAIVGNILNYSRAIGGIAFYLLFFTMLIGPAMKTWPSLYQKLPGDFPYTWRAELGIWFFIWSVIHVLYVFHLRDWAVINYITTMSPWAFGAFVAIIISIPLTITSTKKALNYLGVDAWKWLQSFAYVVFWLTAVHVVDRALLRPGFPSSDILHWTYMIMVLIIPILQTTGFVRTVVEYREKMNED